MTCKYGSKGSPSFRVQSKHQLGWEELQLLDSGSDRELVGLSTVRKRRLATYRLRYPINIQYMDGSMGTPITRATWQTFHINGKRVRISYLVADIPEGFVLGLHFLRELNPDINWQTSTVTWRTPSDGGGKTLILARKARKQIIQGEIASNEAPDWVKRDFAPELRPREKGTLPPHREGFDYEVTMKESFRPRRERPRQHSAEERRMFEELGRIEEAKGFWTIGKGPQCCQMLWAAKAGGKKRPCIDYRPINAHMKDDTYPVPVIRELMMDLAGKKWLTSLDLPAAYNEIRTKNQETKELLAFQCGDKQYEPEVMQFGSKTAVAWFQRFIMYVLRRNIGRGVLAYLDNIIIYCDTEEEHDVKIREVMEDLRAEDLRVRPEKCEWKKQEVQFCGFLVSAEGIRLDPEKLRAIGEWEIPHERRDLTEAQKKTAVREFLGFCNFYKDHTHRYSEIAVPLTELTKPTKKFGWGEKEETSFRLLKTAIMSSPVLNVYNETLGLETHTDACDTAIAGIVEQRGVDGKLKPIGFYSKKLSPAEQNYTVHDKELLAIVNTFKKFRHWLHGSPAPIVAWSDHSALRHFLTTTKLSQRHARWAEALGEFRFEIRHVPGRANRAADALSRKEEGQFENREIARPLREDHFQNGKEVHDAPWKTYTGEAG